MMRDIVVENTKVNILQKFTTSVEPDLKNTISKVYGLAYVSDIMLVWRLLWTRRVAAATTTKQTWQQNNVYIIRMTYIMHL